MLARFSLNSQFSILSLTPLIHFFFVYKRFAIGSKKRLKLIVVVVYSREKQRSAVSVSDKQFNDAGGLRQRELGADENLHVGQVAD